jgi:hypothetical protein
MESRIPHGGWDLRPHQKPLWKYLRKGGLRAMAVWHRRAGKDDVCLHSCAVAMLERQGTYWHCLPQFNQARRVLWDAVNPHTGKRRIDEAFPHEIRETTREQDMFIKLRNGSTWACIASDEYNRTVGASAAGITYSEFALQNPSAWAFHKPMLDENKGWAIFITTPRGRNHAYTMFEFAKKEPGWFAERLTVEDTGVMSPEQLGAQLREYTALYGEDVGSAQYRQELFCDWNAALLGSIYSREMLAVRDEGRILPIEVPRGIPVHRAWDLGTRDDTSIWFFAIVGAQIYVVDHLATSGVGLEWYVDEVEKRLLEHGWTPGHDYVPHDAKVLEFGSGKTRVETMMQLGLKPMLVRDHRVQDGINAVRRTLPLCVFHPRTEDSGISALEQYSRAWDDEKKAFRAAATHDWTSHPADAFRYLSMAWTGMMRKPIPEPKLEGVRIPPPPEPRRGGLRL